LRQLDFVKKGKKNVSEVRNVLPDGTSEFLRPMPGSSRMYPETDLPLLKISRDFINDAKKTLPKSKVELEQELKEEGLSHEMIKLLLQEGKVEEYKQLLKIVNNSSLVVKTLIIWPKEISAKTKIDLIKVDKILEDHLASVLEMFVKNKISESDVKNILEKIVAGESIENALKVERVETGAIEEQVLKIIKEKPGLSANAYMGLVMGQLKGKIDGKTAMEVIQKLL
jgi:glutamyl-tRNA(Gln) amidotransferase subunit E